ncbi:LysM peptidoglycan-binding domain-containing protein [Falsibacillus pallidus]|uniref:LysM domain-containing protein n=1 Tax=Falsibacillus pallidus TaxID=493781 RepID=A0A370GQB0_9BACI|nr:LysM domain-containing protein [Falsibacillus pallidus]RDI44153.1 LysM domain-containing protein [Falsibacillus pallidus]
MNSKWNNRTVFLTGGIIVVILLFILSAWMLIPKQKDIELLNKQLMEEKRLTADGKSSVVNKGNEELAVKTTELQKKIPVKPLIENFILNLEQAQITSGSKLLSVSIQDDGNPASTTAAEGTDTNSAADLSKNLEKALQTENSQETAIPEKSVQLPQGINRVTINLQMEAPGFNELMDFLDSLEGMERIVSIDSVNFAGNREPRTTLDQGLPLTYNVILSIFYYPELEDLVKDLPVIDAPQPSHKVNPLVPTGPIENSGSENPPADKSGSQVDEQTSPADTAADDSASSEKASDEQNKDPTHPAEVLTHIVQPGETLFSIAMKYYHSPEGEETIKTYNNLKENVVYSGTSLKIPIYEN